MSSVYNSIKKNKIDKISLNKQLKTITTANKKEVRLQNWAKSRFRAKYGVSDSIYDDLQTGGSSGNQVKNSGYIYPQRVDGPRGSRTSQEVFNYKAIMDLLFTNGELDTEKILCLHALAIHPCHNIEQAIRSHKVKLSFSNQDFSILDQVSNSSRKGSRNSQYRASKGSRRQAQNATNTLPTYIISFKKPPNRVASYNNDDCCAKEKKMRTITMDTPLIINRNITKLVQTVVEALQKSNSEKIGQLLGKARDPVSIKEILNKPELHEFLNSLSDRTVLLNSGSFQYLPHLKNTVSLNIEDPSGSLENLVNGIRSSMLTQNKHCANNACHKNYDTTSESERRTSKVDEQKKYSLSSNRSYKKDSFDAAKLAMQLRNKVHDANEHDYEEFKRYIASNSSKYGKRAHCSCSSKSRSRFFSNSLEKDVKEYLSRSTLIINKLIDDENQKLMILREGVKQQRRESEELKQIKTKMFNAPKYNRRSSYLMRKARNYSQNFGYTSNEMPIHWNTLNLAKIKYEISAKETEKQVKRFLDEPIMPTYT